MIRSNRPRERARLARLRAVPDQSEELSEIKARLSAVESRVEVAVNDAAAARHLAAARDRDLADLTVKTDAIRSALNGHSVQTAARFDRIEREMRDGFAEMRDGFAVVNDRFAMVNDRFAEIRAGHQHIVDLITGVMERGDER